jgi:hypothetical protein
MFFRASVSTAIVILLSLLVALPARAHSTVPRVEISSERANPGAVISVRGVSFDRDDVVNLTLIGPSTEFSFGEVTADPEGEFTYNASLPKDLGEGAYYFRAITVHHWVISPPFTVWGIAYEEGGGQGPRDEDDGLLAPMPTFAPGVVPGGVPQTPVETAPPPASGWNWIRNVIALAILLLLSIAARFGIKRKNSNAGRNI